MLTINWDFGWLMVCLGLISGGILGLGFHREEFLGGFQSFRRRLCRLGHIALVALGMFNVFFAVVSPIGAAWQSQVAAIAWMLGGFSMPALCFVTAWRPEWRPAFLFPVGALVAAAVLTLIGGPR